jgi:hypothetical protein
MLATPGWGFTFMEASMSSLWKLLAPAAAGLAALGFTAASADHDDGYRSDRSSYESVRPERCDIDHDHRSHNPDYYSYYSADRYSRAGAYRSAGYDDRYDDGRNDRWDTDRDDYDRSDYDRSDGRYRGRGYGDRYGRARSRVVGRDTFRTGYRAEIALVEEIYYNTRSGNGQRVCTVRARGPEARLVTYSQLRRVAESHCSRRADIRVWR